MSCDNKTCIICLSDENELKCRCQCKNAAYHDECIIRWINTKKSPVCEICNSEYIGVVEKEVANVIRSNIKEAFILQFCFFWFNISMWSLYFTTDEPYSCKHKNDEAITQHHRETYERRCTIFKEDMQLFCTTNLILTGIFILTLLMIIFCPESFNLKEYEYSIEYEIDKELIFIRMDDYDNNSDIDELDNEIIGTISV